MRVLCSLSFPIANVVVLLVVDLILPSFVCDTINAPEWRSARSNQVDYWHALLEFRGVSEVGSFRNEKSARRHFDMCVFLKRLL